MDIRVLRNFVQIARDESITKASRRLHISQPALSRQMKELAEELGTTLFVRTNYSIRLTADGIRLRLRAEDLIAMADATVKEFQSSSENISGEIRIGAAEGEAVRLLGKAMNTLKEEYPDILYHLYAGDTELLSEKLDSGFLDYLLIAEDPDLNRYQSISLPIHDTWGLIVKKDDPIAKKKIITPDDLESLELIVSRQAMHQDMRQLFGEKAHKMHIAATYDLAHNGSLLVSEGYGAMLAFDHIVDLSEQTGLVFIPLYPQLVTKAYLIWRKYQIFSPQADLFLQKIRELISENEMKKYKQLSF